MKDIIYDILVLIIGEEKAAVFAKYLPSSGILLVIISSITIYVLWRFLKSRHNKRSVSADIQPSFWAMPGKNHKILAVHKIVKSDHSSGDHQIQIPQDQWKDYIDIKLSRFGLIKTVVSLTKDRLIVVISRDSYEPWQNIHLNYNPFSLKK